MKKLYLLMIAVMVFFAGCTGYDDSEIKDRMDELEDRIEKLETLCREMNTNISSLQSIVSALQNNDYITSVTPIVVDGVEVGYTIDFNKGGEITIYHGKDADDGEGGDRPIIGVRKDADGVYYWTLDGEWLLDDRGNKVRAEGKDGEVISGVVVPKLKIENDYWLVSYDEGKTWTKLDKSTGDDGESMFKEVTYDDGNVYFVLNDGTELSIPRTQPLDIEFDTEVPISMDPNSKLEIRYKVKSSAEDITVEVTSSIDLKAKLVPSGKTGGKIIIQSGSIIDEFSHVLVIVSDGDKTITRSLTFVVAEAEVFEITPKEVKVPAAGGEFDITVLTNIGYYLSNKPSWIKEVNIDKNQETRTAVHTFKAEENTTEEPREGVLVFCNDSQVCIPVKVLQNGVIDWSGESFYHRSVAMRFTADWCGWCPNMAVSLEMAQDMIPGKLEVISMHCDGGLEFGQSGLIQNQFMVTGFPTGIVDGRSLIEVGDINVVADNVKAAVNQTEANYPTISGISFTSSVSEREIKAKVTVHLKNAETYKITAIVVEDNVVAFQKNYVSGDSDEYVHTGVPRMALTNILGESFTVSSENATREFTYSATVPSVYNIDNMRLVVYIQRQFGSQERIQSGNYGDYYIDNCVSGKIGTDVELKLVD